MCGIVGYTGNSARRDILHRRPAQARVPRLRLGRHRRRARTARLAVVHRVGKVERARRARSRQLGCHVGHVRHRPHALGHARAPQRARTPTRTHRLRRARSPSSTTASSRTSRELRDEPGRRRATSSRARPTPRWSRTWSRSAYDGRPARRPCARRPRASSAPTALAVACASTEPGDDRGHAQGLPDRRRAPGAEHGAYVASDIDRAHRRHARRRLARATARSRSSRRRASSYFGASGQAVETRRSRTSIGTPTWPRRGGYPDFMLKEIHEQPRVVRDTLGRAPGRERPCAPSTSSTSRRRGARPHRPRLRHRAAARRYHAGLVAANLIEGWARIPCDGRGGQRVPLPQPHRYAVTRSWSPSRSPARRPTRWPPCAIARVQGRARSSPSPTCVGSRVARESRRRRSTSRRTWRSPWRRRSRFLRQIVPASRSSPCCLAPDEAASLTTRQVQLAVRRAARDRPSRSRTSCRDTAAIDEAALALARTRLSALFIGRGIGAAICHEGALKLKEISYLHAEAYPAGEMKHGPIALLDEGFPVIAIATAEPRARQDGVATFRRATRAAPCRGRGDRGRRGHTAASPTTSSTSRRCATALLGHHGQRAAAAVRARHRRRPRLRRRPAPQPGEIGYRRVTACGCAAALGAGSLSQAAARREERGITCGRY